MPRETGIDAESPRDLGEPAGQGFGQHERLRKRWEYLQVQRRGRRYTDPLLTVIWAPGPCAWTRLGITASRKVGRAVLRNRAKRWIREAFRRNKAVFPLGTDVVIIASPALPLAGFAAVERVLLAWARRVSGT